jgi:hypothetical protein
VRLVSQAGLPSVARFCFSQLKDAGAPLTMTRLRAEPLAPAAELAAAYHERWEAELVFDEIKTHQRGAATVLRSRKPEMAEQEIWGLLLTHYGIRHLIREAADQAGLDPDRMSFMPASGLFAARSRTRRLFPLQRLLAATRAAIKEILERPNPNRRERSYPRKVKRTRHNSFTMKKPEDKNVSHGSPPTIKIFCPAA